MDKGAGRSVSAARGRGSATQKTGCLETGAGAPSAGTRPAAGAPRPLGAGYGLETPQANAACCAGAMGGGSTASFRCRRMFWMT